MSIQSAPVRIGECNTCAACCKFLILQVNPAYMDADRRRWIELHGIRLSERDGGVWARIDIACQHLTDDGKCGVFGTPERPETCGTFPFVQADIDLVDEWAGEKVCSYSFVPEEVLV